MVCRVSYQSSCVERRRREDGHHQCRGDDGLLPDETLRKETTGLPFATSILHLVPPPLSRVVVVVVVVVARARQLAASILAPLLRPHLVDDDPSAAQGWLPRTSGE